MDTRRALVTGLSIVALAAGCSESHTVYPADSDPPYPYDADVPFPYDSDTPPPCLPETCYRVDPDGCCDPSDAVIPPFCGAECPTGYRFQTSCGACPSTCTTAVSDYGLLTSIPGETEATLAAVIDEDGGTRRLSLLTPAGLSIEFRAPAVNLEGLAPGARCRLSTRYEGGFQIHEIDTGGMRVIALRAYNRPADAARFGELEVRLGGTSCSTPSTPAECGTDRVYRLDLYRSFEEPRSVSVGETAELPAPPFDGAAYLVTHGGAVEYGADGCEVFLPFSLSAVITEVQLGG